ncbi:MAG: serine hydrolase [Rhodospirillales bacterium]
MSRFSLCQLTAAAGLALAALTSAPAAADPIERVLSTPTGWLYYYGVTPAQLSTILSSGNYRIVDLQVESVSGSSPVFTVALVNNTGVYGKGWWYYYGQTTAQVSAALTANNARLISVSPYVVSGTTYYATVMVPNTNSDAKTWYWWVGSGSYINSQLTATSTRLVDLEPFTTSSGTQYAAIAIANTGADADSWWWYLGSSLSSLNTNISNNHAQLLTFNSDPGASTYNAAMQGNPTAAWWYYASVSPGTLSALVTENGARLTEVRSIFPGGTRAFNAIMINNSNACTSRIISIQHNNGTGWNGSYLKQVSGKAIPGGPVLCSSADARQFDPASAIKTVIGTYVMKLVQNHQAKLTDTVPLYDPNNFCNFAQIGTESLGNAVTQMLQNSDNARTDMLLKRYSLGTINAYAHSIGMANTNFNTYIDCPGPHTTLTLDDAATLYTGLANHTVLKTANVKKLFSMMAGRNYDFAGMWGDLQPIIAANAGSLTSGQVASFTAAITLSYKSGGYTWPGGTPDLNGQTEYGDEGIDGVVGIPYCSGKKQAIRQFVFGFFHESTASDADQTPLFNAMGAGAQLLTEQVQSALATWNKCG